MDFINFVAAGAIGLVIQGLGFFFYVKFELKQLRKDMEGNDKLIEDKRLANVESLKVIYDQKIDESKKYAKGLFELHSGEFKAINDKMEKVDKSLTQILDILLKK